MSRLAYFTRETFISLRRNLMMTIAGIITVAVTLSLFGGMWLVRTVVDHGTTQWKHGVELEIFMRVDAPQSEVDALQSQLASNKAEIKSTTFLDHQAAYEEFKKIFSDQPALIESTTPDVLPESFRVTPTSAQLTEKVAQEYQDTPGVDTVVTAQEQVKHLLAITSGVNLVFNLISGALLISSLFLIVNTIRLATYARRREIEVMKLVGASNWFVRVPFLAEGFAEGVVGAGFAFGAIYGLKILIANFLSHRHGIAQTFRVTPWDAVGIGIVILILGALIGLIGSGLGLYRFLEE